MRTYRIHGVEHEVNEEKFSFNTTTELNAEATLKEVKEKVGSSRQFKKSPGTVYLRSCGNLVAAATTAGCRMEVYDNGFAIYQTQDTAAVIRMEYVGRCWYEGDPELERGNESIDLSDTAWVVAVMMKGEDRLEKWRGERDADKLVSLLDAGEYDEETGEMTELDVDAGVDIENYIMSEDEKDRLWKAISKLLTRRQKEIVELFYRDCLTQKEISECLGLDHSTVTLTLQRAKNNLKRKFDGSY